MRLILLFLLTFSLNAFSQDAEINWMTWEEAEKATKTEPRKIFVDVWTTWCGWCKRMDKTTFSDPEVINYINNHYYPVSFDAETKSDILLFNRTFTSTDSTKSRSPHELAVELLQGKMSYPSIVFLNESFQRMQVLPGYRSSEDLKPILHFIAEEHFENTPWEDYLKTYNNQD